MASKRVVHCVINAARNRTGRALPCLTSTSVNPVSPCLPLSLVGILMSTGQTSRSTKRHSYRSLPHTPGRVMDDPSPGQITDELLREAVTAGSLAGRVAETCHAGEPMVLDRAARRNGGNKTPTAQGRRLQARTQWRQWRRPPPARCPSLGRHERVVLGFRQLSRPRGSNPGRPFRHCHGLEPKTLVQLLPDTTSDHLQNTHLACLSAPHKKPT